MSFYGKVYSVVSEENVDEFVKSLGLPEDKAKALLVSKPNQKIEKDGDEYKITLYTPIGEKVLKCKSGVEFDDTIRDIPVKLTYTIDGNKVSQVARFENGIIITVKREYTEDKLIEENTNNKWNGVARRIYKQL